EARQFFFAVLVYDARGGEARSRVHAHVERTVSHETETALRIFELSRRNTQIEKHTAYAANTKLVENAIRIAEICLLHEDAPAEMREMLVHMLNCIRILIQSQNIGATFQERFGMAAAAARCIQDERPCFGLE